MEDSKFWRRVLTAKYGVEGRGWGTRPIRGSHGCSLWKGIMAIWDIFQSYIFFEVGKGNKVQFWHDKWCGDRPLKDMFPLLYECSRDRDASIDSLYARTNGREKREWHIRFERDFNAMLYIPFRWPFRFGHWNGIFRYRLIPAFRFGFTANIYIYIYIY